jgi:hypothetical protein
VDTQSSEDPIRATADTQSSENSIRFTADTQSSGNPIRCSTDEKNNSPQEVPTHDAFNNRYIRIVHMNGFHNMALLFCTCRGREVTHCDLMAAGVVPSSFQRYQTVFTHAVLDDIRLTNLECKSSAYQYFQKLCRQTAPMSPDSSPNLYNEIRRMSRIWR